MTSQWIVTPKPNPRAALRLILIPDAGQSLAMFRGWSERLPAAHVGVVLLPGRGSSLHAPPVPSVAAAADRVADELGEGSEHPTVLFGHGLGALVAFETARRLQSRHQRPLAVFVSGQGAPSLGPTPGRVSHLPDDQLVALLQRRHALPVEVSGDPDAVRALLPVLRADLLLMENYAYEPAHLLECPIVACDAAGDGDASRGGIEEWKRETTGRFTVQRFGRDRSYIHREQAALTAVVGNHLSVMMGVLARSAPMQR